MTIQELYNTSIKTMLSSSNIDDLMLALDIINNQVDDPYKQMNEEEQIIMKEIISATAETFKSSVTLRIDDRMNSILYFQALNCLGRMLLGMKIMSGRTDMHRTISNYTLCSTPINNRGGTSYEFYRNKMMTKYIPIIKGNRC